MSHTNLYLVCSLQVSKCCAKHRPLDPAPSADEVANAEQALQVARAEQARVDGTTENQVGAIMNGAMGVVQMAIDLVKSHGGSDSFGRTWVIPVHVGGCHWVLALVNVARNTIQLLDPWKSATGVDHSCQGKRAHVLDAIALLMSAVRAECHAQQPVAVPTLSILPAPTTLLRQADGNSCGIVVLIYIMYLVRRSVLPTADEFALVSSTARRLMVLDLFLTADDVSA